MLRSSLKLLQVKKLPDPKNKIPGWETPVPALPHLASRGALQPLQSWPEFATTMPSPIRLSLIWNFQMEISEETKRRQMGNYQRKQQSIKTEEHQQISESKEAQVCLVIFFFFNSQFSWLKQFTRCWGLISFLTASHSSGWPWCWPGRMLKLSRGQSLDLFLSVTQKDHERKSLQSQAALALWPLLSLWPLTLAPHIRSFWARCGLLFCL